MDNKIKVEYDEEEKVKKPKAERVKIILNNETITMNKQTFGNIGKGSIFDLAFNYYKENEIYLDGCPKTIKQILFYIANEVHEDVFDINVDIYNNLLSIYSIKIPKLITTFLVKARSSGERIIPLFIRSGVIEFYSQNSKCDCRKYGVYLSEFKKNICNICYKEEDLINLGDCITVNLNYFEDIIAFYNTKLHPKFVETNNYIIFKMIFKEGDIINGRILTSEGLKKIEDKNILEKSNKE